MINVTPGMTFKLKLGAYYIIFFTLLKFKVIIILYNFIIGSQYLDQKPVLWIPVCRIKTRSDDHYIKNPTTSL